MGEALVSLNREVEGERSRQAALQVRIGELELEAGSLKDRLELAAKGEAEREERLRAMSAERDRAVEALVHETRRSQETTGALADADSQWDRRLKDLEKRLGEERDARLDAARQACDLRAQAATLTDHIARLAREKEAVEGRSSGWKEERESLLAALRKKDEMISMLSATFQSLTGKKP